MSEPMSLPALVSSLSREVHQLTQDIPDVYISKDEVRQIRRRLRMGLLFNFVCGVLVLGLVVLIRMEGQADRERDRLAGATRAYANCDTVNRAFHGVDVGYTLVFDGVLVGPQYGALHNALRAGLNRTDCSGHLAGLPDEAREKVIAEASSTLPTLPLPPPPR